jgi:two-component system, chemotaxis family, chemotaxis protein CheY
MNYNIRILIVDDSPTIRRIVASTLTRAGFNNHTEACDGKDALEKMQIEKFDLVITDWNMPEMDGLSFVTHVRGSEELKDTPVLMFTSRSVKGDIIEAMKAGVNGYIVKPFTPETLGTKIESIFAKL